MNFDILKRFSPKPKPEPEPEETPQGNIDMPDKVENPVIMMELIDGVHLEIGIRWPENGDIKPFAKFLGVLTSGGLLGPLAEASTIYGASQGQLDKARIIHDVLEQVSNNSQSNGPIVPANKVIANQMKTHGN